MRPSILITGATSGIGRFAAEALAARGANVIIHGRSADRVHAAVAQVGRRAPGVVVEGIVADLARRDAIETMALEITSRLDRLDVLIHNAAVVPLVREVTSEGFEMQFAVNHLAPFLLTRRLLPLLTRSAPSRVVVVASQLERSGRIDFDDLQSERSYDSDAAYRQSKLANVLFAAELARRLAGTGVTSNSLHPGIAGTNLLHALKRKPRWSAALTRYRAPTPEVAIGTIVRLALDPRLSTVTGGYFREEEQAEPSPQARDPLLAARLWSASAALLGIPE